MKFQNPSLIFLTDGRTHGRTDGQAETNMLPLFQSRGHKNRNIHFAFGNDLQNPKQEFSIFVQIILGLEASNSLLWRFNEAGF